MRDDFRTAISHRQKRRFTVLSALLLLIATTACSAGGAAPLPAPTATALPTTTTSPSATRSYSNAHVIDKYKTLIPQIMKENNIPGLSLAVVDDKDVIWAQGFGVTDPVQNKHVTETTLF